MSSSLDILLLLHSAFMLCVVKMALKGEVGGHALNSHVKDLGQSPIQSAQILRIMHYLQLIFCA